MSETEAETAPRYAARTEEIEGLLQGAVDLHCHSGPAAMPRILDHHEAMLEADAAGFRALVYKDHYYGGMAHATILQKVVPSAKVKLFSGIALNNANGGINPHAVDHAVAIGAKIVWMPTLAAANHIKKMATEAKGFPKTSRKLLDPIPLSVMDDAGQLTDNTKKVLDIIAEADIILSGGHLHISEMLPLFEEAGRRGVKKMMVNHPTYLIGCTDEDMRSLVRLGAYLEHSICTFIPGRAQKWGPEEAKRLIEVAGLERTIFCSDLGLTGSPRPVEGYRNFVFDLLELGLSHDEIRTVTSRNAAGLLNLE